MDKSDQGSFASPTDPWCVTCGYHLRSLPIEQSCPECGTPIELSLRGDLLSQSDPAWVARLARGQSLLMFGVRLCLIVMVCTVAIPFLGFGLGFVFASGFGFNIPSWVFSVLFLSFGGALIVGTLFATLGCTLVTTQDPRDSLRESPTSNRTVARKALFAMYACVPASSVAGFLPFWRTSPTIYAVIFFLPVGICFTIALVASLGRLAVLAARIPDHDLGSRTLKSARFFRWAIPVFILVYLISTMGLARASAPAAAGGMWIRPGVFYSVTSCMFPIVALGVLIGSVRMYKNLVTYRTAFRRCATEANTANTEQPLTD
ncbi:MAG: hypothetical protein V3T53_04290 [Phycisphaerales bacterium]